MKIKLKIPKSNEVAREETRLLVVSVRFWKT